MTRPFDSFVLFAEMRTGSNLLEAMLNQIEGITCHGEVFNPGHMGGPNRTEVLGVSLKDRMSDPIELLTRIRAQPGLNGFRYFHDHDPRIFDAVIDDPRCAKIVLTRNPVDCYISIKIAHNTSRWRLTDVRDRRAFRAPYKPAEFPGFLASLQEFQLRILHRLQVSAQTAFYLTYDDIPDLDVLGGLASFLGHSGDVTLKATDFVVQNPEEMSEKVRNFPEMEAELAKIDWANLSRTPAFEPRRGPVVPGFVAARGAPLLYLPIRSGIEARICAWLDGLGSGGLDTEFTRKTLREWQRGRPAHRSFTVVRHPLDRAYSAFRTAVLHGGHADLRDLLIRNYDVALPSVEAADTMTAESVRAVFLTFLTFLKFNLNGQTAIPVDPHWASQLAVIQGFGEFLPPDLICREDRLAKDLAYLTSLFGTKAPAPPGIEPDEAHLPLAEIHDSKLEAAARAAYQKDYVTFGFGNWAPSG